MGMLNAVKLEYRQSSEMPYKARGAVEDILKHTAKCGNNRYSFRESFFFGIWNTDWDTIREALYEMLKAEGFYVFVHGNEVVVGGWDE